MIKYLIKSSNLLFLTVSTCVCAQDATKIYLKRLVVPINSYTKVYQQGFTHDSIAYDGGGNYVASNNYRVIAGDYSDQNAKFTLAINIFQNHKGKTVSGETDIGSYQAYVAPFKSDSIYIVPCNPRSAEISPLNPFIIAVGKQEYKCTLSQDIKSFTIIPLTNEWVYPKFKLYDNQLPHDTFKTISGIQNTFQEFENKNKYIYVMASGFDPLTKKPDVDFNALKGVSEEFKNQLTIIIFTTDGDLLQNLQSVKGANWIVSTFEFFPGCDFQFNFMPNGVLFDSKGLIANRGILPSELRGFLEKQKK